jgi:hypothetical protein
MLAAGAYGPLVGAIRVGKRSGAVFWLTDTKAAAPQLA